VVVGGGGVTAWVVLTEGFAVELSEALGCWLFPTEFVVPVLLYVNAKVPTITAQAIIAAMPYFFFNSLCH